MGETCALLLTLRELRNLRPYRGGLPSPLLQITCHGQVYATTSIPPGLNSSVDQTFLFPNLPVTPVFFQETTCTLVLFHTKEKARVKLGQFELSLDVVYASDQHKVKGKWCALVGNNDLVAGYVLINAHLGDSSADDRDEDLVINEEDDSAILGMPENLIQSYQLTVNVHKAENLPAYGVKNSISALVEVLLGTKSVQTRIIQDETWPQWREKLLLPTIVPNVVRFIRIRLVHLGRNRAEEVVDEVLIDFAVVVAGRIPPSWYHVYTGKYKEIYAGRLLLSLALEPHNRPVTAVEAGPVGEEPPLAPYKLWLYVPEVAGLDYTGKLKVRFECGTFSTDSQYEESSNRRWLWREKAAFPQATLELPVDFQQVPKMILKIITNSIEQREVCVAMFCPDTKSILEAGSYQKPLQWQRLTSMLDPRIVETKKTLTGSILFSVNLMQNIRHNRKTWSEETAIPSEIWVNVYQAKDITAVYNSSFRAIYAQVSVLGVTKVTNALGNSDNPQWNQVLKWRMNLPLQEKYIWVDVWDANPWPSENSFIGTAAIPDEDIEIGHISTPKIPLGKYYEVRNQAQEVTGKILLSVISYPLKSREERVGTVAISGDMHKCVLQLLIVGTRKVKSFGPKLNFKPIVKVTAGADLVQETTKSERWLDNSENNHNILETLEFPLLLHKSPERAPVLTLRVYESNAYTRSLLGTSVLDLNTYLPWIPKVQIQPVALSPTQAREIDHSQEELNESFSRSKEEIEEIKETYGEFFLGCEDMSKLNYQIDTSGIEVTDTTEVLMTARELMSREPRQWPGYVPQNYNRPKLTGPLELVLPAVPVYETLWLKTVGNVGNFVTTGLIKAVVRLIEPKTKSLISLDSIRRDVVNTKYLSARLYFLSLDKSPPIPSDSSLIISCKTYEGDEKYRIQVEPVELPNQCVELMTAVKVTLTLPDHAYVTVEVYVQTGETMTLLGSTEIDVEQRWFCREFQEIRTPTLRQVPIERRRLETGDSLITRGELVLWMDLLTIDESAQFQPERLIPSTPSPFELRLVIWRVFDLSFDQPVNVMVKISVQEGSNVLTSDTDAHQGAVEAAEFNWRCVFAINLPQQKCYCKAELVYVGMKGVRENLGEVMIDFAGFYLEVMKEDEEKSLPKAQFPLVSSSSELIGQIELEASLLSLDEAEDNPVGSGRTEPNRDPYLPFPQSGRTHGALIGEIEVLQTKEKRTHRRLTVLLMGAASLILLVTVPIVLVGLGVI